MKSGGHPAHVTPLSCNHVYHRHTQLGITRRTPATRSCPCPGEQKPEKGSTSWVAVWASEYESIKYTRQRPSWRWGYLGVSGLLSTSICTTVPVQPLSQEVIQVNEYRDVSLFTRIQHVISAKDVNWLYVIVSVPSVHKEFTCCFRGETPLISCYSYHIKGLG